MWRADGLQAVLQDFFHGYSLSTPRVTGGSINPTRLTTVITIDSCVLPFSLADLSTLVETHAGTPLFDTTTPLAYGPIQGRPELRANIADLLSSSNAITGDDVVVTAGAILANYLVLTTLCSPGDHVVVQYPTYQQLYELPRTQGAEVSLWRMREEDGWLPDLGELEGLLRPETRLIVVK